MRVGPGSFMVGSHRSNSTSSSEMHCGGNFDSNSTFSSHLATIVLLATKVLLSSDGVLVRLVHSDSCLSNHCTLVVIVFGCDCI